MILTALTAPSLLAISALEKKKHALIRTHKRTVQQRATQKLIQRRIIDRQRHIDLNKPGWSAPIYSVTDAG